MNIQEFIETSGVLEEYVLGTLPEKERLGVECLAQTYTEVHSELQTLQQALEKYTFLYQRTPPVRVKENVFSQMQFSTAEEEEPVETISTDETADVYVAQTNGQPAGRQVLPMWGLISVAASVLFLVGAGWLYSQNSSLKATNSVLVAQVETIQDKERTQANLLAAYSDPNNRILPLKGVEKSKDSHVTVFWNQTNNEVHLRVDKLPQPGSDEQYQLWTIVDGTPVDMGVIDNDFKEKLLAMKAVNGKPMAFAITLEKAGGSPSPTLEDMYVMGEV